MQTPMDICRQSPWPPNVMDERRGLYNCDEMIATREQQMNNCRQQKCGSHFSSLSAARTLLACVHLHTLAAFTCTLTDPYCTVCFYSFPHRGPFAIVFWFVVFSAHQLEQAWWFYEDFIADAHKHLPHFKLKVGPRKTDGLTMDS